MIFPHFEDTCFFVGFAQVLRLLIFQVHKLDFLIFKNLFIEILLCSRRNIRMLDVAIVKRTALYDFNDNN